jgi:N-dimethylarginine dimethylaminohydrolase
MLLANFTTECRVGEEKVARLFFESMGLEVVQCPFKWEGEAEIKHVRDNIYIGGFGVRTDPRAYDWMRETFGMRIIAVPLPTAKVPGLYHFDLVGFQIDDRRLLLNTSAYTPEELERYGSVVKICALPPELEKAGPNYCIIGDNLFAAQFPTAAANEAFERMCDKLGLNPVLLDLTEFAKSGAGIGCMTMQLGNLMPLQ